MFINYTNHTSELWSEKQKKAAMEYGEIIDIPFPSISPLMKEEDIYILAGNECKKIRDRLNPSEKNAVLCQGEFNLTFLLVKFLHAQDKNLRVFSAVSERKVKERVEGNVSLKEVEFCFQGFREYDRRNKING